MPLPDHQITALEALSVGIAEIAEEANVLAATTPPAGGAPRQRKCRQLVLAGQDIAILAQAMEVLTRRG